MIDYWKKMDEISEGLIGKLFTINPERTQYEIMDITPLNNIRTTVLYAILYHTPSDKDEEYKFLFLTRDDLERLHKHMEVGFQKLSEPTTDLTMKLDIDSRQMYKNLIGKMIECRRDGKLEQYVKIGGARYSNGKYCIYGPDGFRWGNDETKAIAYVLERHIQEFSKGNKTCYNTMLFHEDSYKIID